MAEPPKAPAAKERHHSVPAYVEPDVNQISAPAFGNQIQSKRNNAPSLSFGKATRKQREKVFISHEASSGQLNADTPGAIYQVNSTLNLASGQKFGTGPQRTFGRWKPKYDYELKRHDKMGEITARANRFR